MMKNAHFVYQMPTKVVFGLPLLKALEEVKQFGSRALTITGKKFVFKTGLLDKTSQLLRKNDVRAVAFSEVESDPDFDTISKAVKLARKEKIDFILAIGGGSVLDVAKLVAASYNNPEVDLVSHTEKGEVQSCMWKGKRKSLDVIAVPTTSGSGSEVSKAVVVTDMKHRMKCSIKSFFFTPHWQ